MSPVRRVARLCRAAWRRLRFRLWAARLDLQLRRSGGRLRLDAPHGAWLVRAPTIRALPLGGDKGVFELSVGRDVRIGAGLVLDLWAGGENRLVLGDGVGIYDGVRIELRSGTIELGRKATVRDLTLLKSYGALGIGELAIISRGVVIQCQERIELGARSALGEWVSLIDSDHSPDGSDVHFIEQPLRAEPVVLGSNVLVARGAVVLRGARLGRNSVVGANSVVLAGDYPPGRVLAGVPASVAKRLPKAPSEEA